MKHLLHKIICWYLRRCACAFHCYSYGPEGRYAVLMNERQYHRYTMIARDNHIGEPMMKHFQSGKFRYDENLPLQ